ncbi:MAG: ArsR family transcriptional regulator [Gammaproteobacteria bacterium]|nr:MAG: ArsR family transcriptional regulator [Gammaproteobacteria bacterium]
MKQNTALATATLHPIQPDQVNPSLLTFCKAFADQLRLDILRVLSRDSFGVLELVQIFESKQSGISHHLKILANAGLVSKRREGNSIFYRRSHTVNAGELSGLQKELYKTVELQQLSPSVEQRLTLIQQSRVEQSQFFFRDNADRFSQHQEQVAAYEMYGVNAGELITSSFQGKDATTGTVVEIGPGEGEFLESLSATFDQVVAVDNSSEMLAKAQGFARSHTLDNIEFILGDTKHPALNELSIDCLVMNMVLHHVPSPAEVIFDIYKVLNTGGQFFVTELCTHDQSWVQGSCGDLWLGFEPEDLGSWATNVGFIEGESVYLAQRNGFRVQIRQFLKL